MVSLENPFSLVTVLLTEGLDALLKGQLWAQFEATPSREKSGWLLEDGDLPSQGTHKQWEVMLTRTQRLQGRQEERKWLLCPLR